MGAVTSELKAATALGSGFQREVAGCNPPHLRELPQCLVDLQGFPERCCTCIPDAVQFKAAEGRESAKSE